MSNNGMVKFEFTPEENQQIDATIILPKESRSVIHGVVKNYKNCILEDAVVKLFEVVEHCGKCELKPIGHTFTDEFGEFLFGPLCPNRPYVIKVWVNDIKIKEIVINPDPDDPCSDDPRNDDPCEDEDDDCKPQCKHPSHSYYRKRENCGRYVNKYRDNNCCEYEEDEEEEEEE